MPAIEAVILDSSALLELFTDSERAEEVGKIWDDENVSVEVPSIVLAELFSVLERKGLDTSDMNQKISESCTILDLTREIAIKAGKLHAELKKKDRTISMADCIIMAHADNEGAMVITLDQHFRFYQNARLL